MMSTPSSGKPSSRTEESPVELEHLFWFIKGSGKGLAIAQVNAPVLREKLVENLTRRCRQENISTRVLSLKPDLPLFTQIEEAYAKASPKPNAIFVQDFNNLSDHLKPEEIPDYVKKLNFGRETLTRMDTVVVFWLPAHWHTLLLKYAPDLYDWRGIVLEFEAGITSIDQTLTDISESRYPAETRRKMIRILENQFKEAKQRKEQPSYFLTAYLLPLARLYWEDQQINQAQNYYQEALELAEEIHDKSNISVSLHQLGMLQHFQGNYSQARELNEQSLKIKEKLGDQAGIASSLHNMAMIHQDQGNYSQAQELYERSLKISEKLGDQAGIAFSLHQMGNIQSLQGDYSQARELYERSLKIFEKLGNQDGIASSLHQMARIHQAQGNYSQAQKLYERSLKISEKLGNQDGIASSSGQLGSMAEEQGELTEAVKFYARALFIFEKLNSPDKKIAANGLARVKEKLTKNI